MKHDDREMLKCYRKALKKELINDLEMDFENCVNVYEKHRHIASMIDTICNINDIIDGDDNEDDDDDKHHEKPELKNATIMKWADGMENADGSDGAHWTIEQATSVANQLGVSFDHISPEDFWITLNMMYSDYGQTLQETGITDAGIYGRLATDFLFDKDAIAPKEKLYYYYKDIVEK